MIINYVVIWLAPGVFPSQYSAPIHWLVHGHMTSINETVCRQCGNIVKTMTSNGKQQFTEMFTAVARDQSVQLKPGGVLPYMGYIGMCGSKGYGFSAVLVINRVSILADLGHK